MGVIFSRYRRKKTTDEILEEIQSDIVSLEDNRDQTLQRQKYWIGRLYIYSIILYILIAALFYFCFFPVSLADRLFYIIPLLGFPVIVILLKKFINWYYKREIINSKDKLSDLKAKKKKILEDVMNKETYKVAKEILEKYAPEQIKKSSPPPGFSINLPPMPPPESANQSIESTLNDSSSKLVFGPPSVSPLKVPRPSQISKGPGPPAITHGPSQGMLGPQKPPGPMVLQRQPSPQRRLVRPIIPRERNFIDKIIESLVGDGPSNRYALICRNCASHNGMALKEEFEYLAFRCAYCGFPNPAHKVRPRPSVQLRDRAPSEDRKSVDGQKVDGTTDDERSVDGDSKDSDVPREGDEKRTAVADNEGASANEIPSASNSSDESSAPADGIRPRKPQLLADN